MPHLECVNEEFEHYFIVDTPPTQGSLRKGSSFRERKVNPKFKPKDKSGRSISLLIKRCKAFFYNLYV